MDKAFQDKVDTLINRVYRRGGGVSATSDSPGGYLISIVGLPGIITKFESLGDATVRFEAWERERRRK